MYPEKNLQKFEKDNNYCQGCPVGKWGKMKKCKQGSFAIGAEIGLHDDYGLSNFKVGDPKRCTYYDRQHSNGKWDLRDLLTYRASVINLRLYCSEYQVNDQGESTTKIQGDINEDFETDHWMRSWNKPDSPPWSGWSEPNKGERLSEQYIASHIHKHHM